MKIKVLITALAVLLGTAIHAEDGKGIAFESGTFSQILAKAKQENKLVFLDAYTSWCGPCKWLAKNVFTNDTAAGFYNSHFINASFDMEKGEGVDIAKKYDVRCYPTLLFIDGDGNLVHRQSGAIPVSNFVELGQTAMTPAKRYGTFMHEYDRKKITSDNLVEYMQMRRATCLPVDEQMQQYAASQKDADLQNSRNWMVYREFVSDPASPMFRYLLAHRSEFAAKHTADSVDMVIENVYGTAMNGCLRSKTPDTVKYKQLCDEVLKQQLPFSEKLVLGMNMNFYSGKGDWKSFAETASQYADKYAQNDPNALNNIAWAFYQHVDDTTQLEKGLAMIRRSMEIQANYYNTDTYTAILYKLGRYKEAQAAAEKAIALADQAGIDCSGTKALLEKLKGMK